MIETVNTAEESLWRAVILRYSSDIFKLKVEMDQAHIKMQMAGRGDDILKWQRYKREYEKSAFKMQKFKNELNAVTTNGSEVLPLREICENASVSFDVFKIRIISIIEGVVEIPDTGKKFMFQN